MPPMDDTRTEQLLRELEEADPAEAPDAADALAEELEADLEAGRDEAEAPS